MSLKLFEKYDKELTEFQEWIKSKPHLPQNMGMKEAKIKTPFEQLRLFNILSILTLFR